MINGEILIHPTQFSKLSDKSARYIAAHFKKTTQLNKIFRSNRNEILGKIFPLSNSFGPLLSSLFQFHEAPKKKVKSNADMKTAPITENDSFIEVDTQNVK